MKNKYNIGQLIKYSTQGSTHIAEITSVEFAATYIRYHLDSGMADEADVIASYTQDKVAKERKKRTAKPKKIVDVIV
jgi:hypothetical protein